MSGDSNSGRGVTTTTTSTAPAQNDNLDSGSGSDANSDDADASTGDEVEGDAPGGGGDDGDGTGAIIGAAAGGGALCLVLAVALLLRRRKKSSKNRAGGLPKGWSTFIDEASGYPCYVSPSGETQWDPPAGTIEMGDMTAKTANPLRSAGAGANQGHMHHSRGSTQIPVGWDKHVDDEGNRFYAHDESGTTSWEPPEGSTGGSAEPGTRIDSLLEPTHARSHTVGTVDGAKYYLDEHGETTWDKPVED